MVVCARSIICERDTQARSVLRITLQRWSDFGAVHLVFYGRHWRAALTPGQWERLVIGLCESRRTSIARVRTFRGAASPSPGSQTRDPRAVPLQVDKKSVQGVRSHLWCGVRGWYCWVGKYSLLNPYLGLFTGF